MEERREAADSLASGDSTRLRKKEDENGAHDPASAQHLADAAASLSRCCVALFLDYDGTGGRAPSTRLSLFLYIVTSLTRRSSYSLAISPI